MFSKAALTFLVVGALSVNALTIPVARSPAPEPESQELKAGMLKRDLSYELFSRELQALEELFSRDPEGWAEWAGSARDYYTAKREPSPKYVKPGTPLKTNHEQFTGSARYVGY